MAERRLPKGYDVEKHFGPRYNVWDQRLCLAPDGDWEHCGMTAGIQAELFNKRRGREFESLWSALRWGIPNLADHP